MVFVIERVAALDPTKDTYILHNLYIYIYNELNNNRHSRAVNLCARRNTMKIHTVLLTITIGLLL